jgi:hypothetical protein
MLLLLLGGPPPWRRVREAALFLAIAGLPMALWLARNRWVAHTLTHRAIAFHPITTDQMFAAAATFARWFAPPPVPDALIKPLALTGTVFLGGLVLQALLRGPQGPDRQGRERFMFIVILDLIAYFAFLWVSMSFFDALIPLGWRLLSPVWVLGLILVLNLAQRLAPAVRERRGLRVIAAALMLVIAVCSVTFDAVWLENAHRLGRFFSTPDWAQSPLIAKVRQLPAYIPLYSNTPDAIYLYTGRLAFDFPVRRDTSGDLPPAQYQADLLAAAQRLKNQGGLVVYFDTLSQHAWPPLPAEIDAELKQAWRLKPIDQALDGTIYGVE